AYRTVLQRFHQKWLSSPSPLLFGFHHREQSDRKRHRAQAAADHGVVMGERPADQHRQRDPGQGLHRRLLSDTSKIALLHKEIMRLACRKSTVAEKRQTRPKACVYRVYRGKRSVPSGSRYVGVLICVTKDWTRG